MTTDAAAERYAAHDNIRDFPLTHDLGSRWR